MIQNSYFSNPQIHLYQQRSPDLKVSSKAAVNRPHDKFQSFETSTGDISQDLIKELTLKNKLLNAQLVQYKTLVSNLNQRLQDLEQDNQKLRNMLDGRLQSVKKLHTIEEQLNSLSEITTKSRRRQSQEVRQQYYFHQFSQMLNSFDLHSRSLSWEAFISVIESALQERKSLNHFISSIRQMKAMIQPGADNLFDLWQWLKKLGWNYLCLIDHTKSRDKKQTKK